MRTLTYWAVALGAMGLNSSVAWAEEAKPPAPAASAATPPSAAPAAASSQSAPAASPADSAEVAEASSADPSASEEVALEESAAPTSTIEWKRPMTMYELGQRDEALTDLRTQVLACGDASEGRCSRQDLSTLYACVGIVLSGKGDHHGGVQAFKKALEYNPKVGILPTYRTRPVQAAFSEAQGVPIAPPATTGAPAATPRPAPVWDEPEVEPIKDKGIFLISGVAKGGGISDGFFSSGAMQLGGAVTLAGNPAGESGFALGGRVRGGGYVAGGSLGYLGASAIIGSVIGPRKDDKFGYFFGGAGFESYPASGATLATLHFIGGGSIGGFLLGGGLDMAFNGFGAAITVGLEIGFGTSVKRH